MQVKAEKVELSWTPKKLEIIFETKEEYIAFRGMVRTNLSVPEAVYGSGGYEGESEEKEHQLYKILKQLSIKLGGDKK